MSNTPKSNNGTRSLLNETVKTITQLEKSIRTHVEQEGEILSRIQSLEFQLADEKQQYAQIKSNIHTIRQSVVQMRAVEQNLRRILSPMKHLPSDILLCIFRILVQQAERRRDQFAEHWSFADPRDRYLPLRLSQVCRNWRSIFAANSLLWPTVEAYLYPVSFDAVVRQQARLAHWRKSGDTIHKTLFVYGWTEQNSKLLPVLLNTEPLEWKAIKVGVDQDMASPWNVGSIQAQQVTIYRDKVPTLRSLVPLMRQASVLTIYGPPPEWGGLPWIHLRSFTLKIFARKLNSQVVPLLFGHVELTALLNAATELTDLVLDFPAIESGSPKDQAATMIHRKLSSISLHLRHFEVGKGPFGVQLIAPSLQRLNILSLHRKYSKDGALLVSIWDNPKVLSLPPMKDEDVATTAELCGSLPNVHTLKVTGQNVETLFVFLQALFRRLPPQSQPFPLPKLSSLFITNTDLTGETLIDLLESRLQRAGDVAGVSRVTEVRMYDSPGVTPAHWSRITRLLHNLSLVN